MLAGLVHATPVKHLRAGGPSSVNAAFLAAHNLVLLTDEAAGTATLHLQDTVMAAVLPLPKVRLASSWTERTLLLRHHECSRPE